jgi:hypothetical protein
MSPPLLRMWTKRRRLLNLCRLLSLKLQQLVELLHHLLQLAPMSQRKTLPLVLEEDGLGIRYSALFLLEMPKELIWMPIKLMRQINHTSIKLLVNGSYLAERRNQLLLQRLQSYLQALQVGAQVLLSAPLVLDLLALELQVHQPQLE